MIAIVARLAQCMVPSTYTYLLTCFTTCLPTCLPTRLRSEGISFDDDDCRGVVCVGVPLPNKVVVIVSSKSLHGTDGLHASMVLSVHARGRKSKESR